MRAIKTIKFDNTNIQGDILLPLSKSFCNRQLMIYSYAGWDINELEISTADDSVLLQSILLEIEENEQQNSIISSKEIYCKNAGTVARFILPYMLTKSKEYILKGSDRMQKRPIIPLLNSLVKNGGKIKSIANDNKLPFKISSSKLNNKNIEIDISESSQFASAILMMLPSQYSSSNLLLKGDLSSMPYIILTLEIMKLYGIDYKINGREILLNGRYQKSKNIVNPERDWSSASYFYELIAMKGKGELLLRDLQLDSLQGDSQLADVFSSLGVESIQTESGVLIKANNKINFNQNIDFNDIPDLAPAIICSCAAIGVIGKFTGLQSLNLKESRRMNVLCAELDKLAYDLRDNGFGEYLLLNSCKVDKSKRDFSKITINTANDHRMAMAFAPFAIIGSSIKISDSESVEKSFPDFWRELCNC